MSILFWWVVVPLAVFFGLGALLGAPYLPIRRQDREELLDIAGLKPGQRIIDLGSGDGTFLLAAAKRGVHAVGYEINPLLCLVAYARSFKYRKFIKIRWRNFWGQSLPRADVIYVFLIERYMTRLENKLQTEITKPTMVISYVFKLPNLKTAQKTRNAFIYKIPAKQ